MKAFWAIYSITNECFDVNSNRSYVVRRLYRFPEYQPFTLIGFIVVVFVIRNVHVIPRSQNGHPLDTAFSAVP
jgi:hypothetical protein